MAMDIQSRPELEELIRHDVERGYQSIEHAVSLLHAHASWFAEDRAEVNAKGAGGAAAELLDAD
jgi:hypothetical protein